MKKRALFFVFLAAFLSLFSKVSTAQDHGFGIGVILGEPTGISGKFWLAERSAIDFGFGLSVGGDRLAYNGNSKWTRVHLHVDYLYHFFDVIRTNARLPLYFGAGPRVNFAGGYDASFGIRGVAGIAWLVDRLPLDIFLEAVPVFQVGHKTGLGLEGGVGARYYF